MIGSQFPAARTSTRPALHMTARHGWINDPIGLTHHDGLYHLFYQYLPEQVTWSPECRWGHAVSHDLLTWTERGTVLQPGDGDGGCWSGSLVIDADGKPVIFYTSIQPHKLDLGQIRTAHPDDDTWDTWHKGPVIAAIAPPSDSVTFRDPHVSRDTNGWRMLVGAGQRDGTATALAYTSPDLAAWSFAGEFASRSSVEHDPLWTGKVWECPQLIRLDDTYVLVFSAWEPWIPHYEAYAIGHLVDGQFIIKNWGRLSYGDSYYAAATFADSNGKPGLIHWLRGIEDPHERWAGAHSVPHRLRLTGNALVAEPHPNISVRRGRAARILTGRTPRQAALMPVADVEWALGRDRDASLSIRDTGGHHLHISAHDAQLHVEVDTKSWLMPRSANARIIVDGPIFELFSEAGVFSAPIPVGSERTISITNSACTIYDL